jgi:hypothetical protein
MSSIEKRVERPAHRLVDPSSGEEVELVPAAIIAQADPMKLIEWIDQADAAEIAFLLRSLMDFELDEAKPIKRRMKERILAELDRLGGVMTREFEGVKVEGDSAAAAANYRSVDSVALAKTLRKLVKVDLLDKSVFNDVFKREMKITVNRPAVERLRKIEGPVGEAVEACMVAAPRDRDVKVAWR